MNPFPQTFKIKSLRIESQIKLGTLAQGSGSGRSQKSFLHIFVCFSTWRQWCTCLNSPEKPMRLGDSYHFDVRIETFQKES